MQVVRQAIGYATTNAYDTTPIWSAATEYTVGVDVAYVGRIYRCIGTGNIGQTPDTSPAYWYNYGPTNDRAYLDPIVGNKTVMWTFFTDLTFEFTDITVDSVGLFGLEGSTVNLTVYETTAPGAAILYSDTQSIGGDVILDWYQYFFYTSATPRESVLFQGLPPILTSKIVITITPKGSDFAKVGYILAGVKTNLGLTQYGMTSGILDYSKKETDPTYGTTEFAVKSYSKKVSAIVLVPTEELNRVQRTLYGLRAKPALWIFSEDPLLEEPSVLFGFYRDFNTEISMPGYSTCSLDVEGLV